MTLAERPASPKIGRMKTRSKQPPRGAAVTKRSPRAMRSTPESRSTSSAPAAAVVPAAPDDLLIIPGDAEAQPASLPKNQQNSTLTGSVYQQLRTDVLQGRLRPGEKLRAEALRRRFHTTSSPIREALNRLLVEGFVSLEEQKGFRVAPVSAADLSELVKARIWIDGIAITESIKRSATDWEENLILALHRLSKSRRGGSSQADMEWEKLHRAFHLALINGCGSRWIIRISERLFDAAERYRLLTAHELSERDELAEHRAIVDACTRGEGERAMKLLEHHYGQTFERIAGSMAGKAFLAKE